MWLVKMMLAHLELRLELRLKPKFRLKSKTKGNPPSPLARSWLVAVKLILRKGRKRKADKGVKTLKDEGLHHQVAGEDQHCIVIQKVGGSVAGPLVA